MGTPAEASNSDMKITSRCARLKELREAVRTAEESLDSMKPILDPARDCDWPECVVTLRPQSKKQSMGARANADPSMLFRMIRHSGRIPEFRARGTDTSRR